MKKFAKVAALLLAAVVCAGTAAAETIAAAPKTSVNSPAFYHKKQALGIDLPKK